MYLEYIIGPVLSLLLGVKFTQYAVKKQQQVCEVAVAEKIVESNTAMSQQMIKLLMPVAKNMTRVNSQLGL